LRVIMAALGPVVVVSEKPSAELAEALGEAGAFPIIETNVADAASAIAEIKPAALILADAEPWPTGQAGAILIKAIETGGGPFMPVLARVSADSEVSAPHALPVGVDEPAAQLVARLRSALRVRALHATVLRRTGANEHGKTRTLPSGLLDQATILCMGRGRSYPALTTAIGERVGLVGALSVEMAARSLNARDIDGIVIGDGFSPQIVEALLTVLAEDARFRDLPVGMFGSAAYDETRLPNLIRLRGSPDWLIERFLPLVQLQAFESHLKRMLKSVDSDGALDPETGLLSRAAFWRDLDRAVQQAEDAGGALSIARFTFEGIDRRASVDAARLFSRLVRNIDFACREQDGAIIAAFTETDLRSAHVVVRRLASVLKHTVLSSEQTLKPTVTLATLKPSDNLSSLVARVGTYPKVAVR
jgi:GGDEF domain-containing protein